MQSKIDGQCFNPPFTISETQTSIFESGKKYVFENDDELKDMTSRRSNQREPNYGGST